MAQRSTFTCANRYPGIFATVKALLTNGTNPESDFSTLRILSFGCSRGSEIQSLRAYFPMATIFGCDVNLEALAEAKVNLLGDDGALFFLSTPENIKAFGPYDLIFAMSVLCRYPESTRCNTLDGLFSFGEFEEQVSILSECLGDGGVLCIYNSNYFFTDLAVSQFFRPIRSQLIATNGFVDKFSRSGARISTLSRVDDVNYFHRIERSDHGLSDIDFLDCIYQRRSRVDSREPIFVRFPRDAAPPILEDLGETRRFGVDLDAAREKGEIAHAFFSRSIVSLDGSIWLRREFRCTTVSHSINSLGGWWSRGGKEQFGQFSIPQKLAIDQLSDVLRRNHERPDIKNWVSHAIRRLRRRMPSNWAVES